MLQHNIALINLWTEYRYKGYRYLRKSNRRKLYANLERIAHDFEQFRLAHQVSGDEVLAHVHSIAPHAHPETQRAILIEALMHYFSPQRAVYTYRESSSFGRLLRDPARESLEGDCNQIVTLYIYLYSHYFSISDLKIRLLPGHVALHYEGVDIEATNGTFMNYDEVDGAQLLPIEEIVSVNLLDTTDSYLARHEVSPQDFLQASRFAMLLSHERDIVTHNLEAAYRSLIAQLMGRHNYTQALKFARASRDMELLAIVGNNGALYHMQQHEFAAARRYAEFAPKCAELVRDSYRAEGVYHYDAGRYHDAITAFKHYGDDSLIRRCYEGLFFVEQAKLGDHITSETIKKYAPVVKHMDAYARKSGNHQLIDHASRLKKAL